MCGIAGILVQAGPPPDLKALGRMLRPLRSRGPDGAGRYQDEHIALGHTRLAIVDPDGGAQPLSDGRRVVTFNGEILNHVELRAELSDLGYHFRTRSDTEVLLHAFDAWGEACLPRFVGQWAFAIWDPTRRRLTLSRDRFGICPLHVARTDAGIYFASTPEAIFAGHTPLSRRPDPVALDQAARLWSPLTPRTAFDGIEQLEPGAIWRWDPAGHQRKVWWQWRFPDQRDSFDNDALDAALSDAVRLRALRSDVPVGAYLSGGLDSTLLVALAQPIFGRPITTFSVGFEASAFDESPWQDRASEALGTEHHSVRIGPGDIATHFPAVVRAAGRPLQRTAPVPLYVLSERVRAAGIRVVLTGEGADELFAGYDLFRAAKVRRFWARHPDSLKRPKLLARLYPTAFGEAVQNAAFARRYFGRDLDRAEAPTFGHALRWAAGTALHRLMRPAMTETFPSNLADSVLAALPNDLPQWSPLARDQAIEARTLLSEYLLSAQGDRMLLSHGVEGRFPFLDHRVAALAASLRDVDRLPGLLEKACLKRLARGRIPESIRQRTKQPYRAPDAASFVGPNTPEWVRAVTSPAAVRQVGIFDSERVQRLMAKAEALVERGRLSRTDDAGVVFVLSTQVLFGDPTWAPGRSGDRGEDSFSWDVDLRGPLGTC